MHFYIIVPFIVACSSLRLRHGILKSRRVDMKILDYGKNVLAGLKKTFVSSTLILATSIPQPVRASKSAASAESIHFSQKLKPKSDVAKQSPSQSSFGATFVRDAVRKVGPSVVRIDCEREVPSLMSMFTPDGNKEGETVRVSGSGFVVSSDGYILTNAHVVSNAKRITVTLSNGRTFRSSVVAFDDLTDLAALKADLEPGTKLVKAPIGDSSSLQSGDWLIAVGCPVGLDFTVTLGIVSAPKRSAAEVGAPQLKGTYIQTDAALNSGNSGGPLVNDMGQVIGINTMVRTNTEAIGFAIPINRAMEIFEILKQGKKPTHAYFGLEVGSITPDNARINNDDPNSQRLPEVKGALVLRVTPGSPASTAFRKYDVIINVNGNKVNSADDADIFLDACKPDSPARVTVMRGENAGQVELKVSPHDLLTIIQQRQMQRR